MDARNRNLADYSEHTNRSHYDALTSGATNDGYDDPVEWIREEGAVYACEEYGVDLDWLVGEYPELADDIEADIRAEEKARALVGWTERSCGMFMADL